MPEITTWLDCALKYVDYYTTQAISVHGSFRSCPYKINKATDEFCMYCAQRDDPAHIIYCNRWLQYRTNLESKWNVQITPDNLIPNMLINRKKLKGGACFLRQVMKAKEEEEREHQRLVENPR
ncbi:hypothetical protein JTB14_000611 [Gonioctena quinquepunctata]|nr:hypothetical protein JTB14_000611 [Gonioctena quinquepunctata]